MDNFENNKTMDNNKLKNDLLQEDQSKMIFESQEITSFEKSVMKGDTIGDTMYSAKWILRALINLSKVYEEGWNESLENELCLLWDMTTEKDVVQYLIENNFLKIAEFNIKESTESRLTEILVGIIGNMSCEKVMLDALTLSHNLVHEILYLLTSEDTETLIQVLRVLQALTWDIKRNTSAPWLKKFKECDFLGEAIIFILKSSKNDDLLSLCIDFVYLIFELPPLLENSFSIKEIFDINLLIYALCESLMELLGDDFNLQSCNCFKSIENWFNIINIIIKKELLSFADNSDENFIKMNETVIKILKPFENSNYLFPLEERGALYIQQCIEIVYCFQKNQMTPNIDLIVIIFAISNKLNIEPNYEDNEGLIKQLYDYSKNYCIETLKNLSKEQTLFILRKLGHETSHSIFNGLNLDLEILKEI